MIRRFRVVFAKFQIISHRLGIGRGTLVEFGAWDGRHLSNTCHLVESRGYSAVLIEGDEKRAARSQERKKQIA